MLQRRAWWALLLALVLLASLAALGYAPRLAHWLHGSRGPADGATAAAAVAVAIAVIATGTWLGARLPIVETARAARRKVVAGRAVLTPAGAYERFVSAVDRLQRLGYRTGRDAPSADALPALDSARLVHGRSWLSDDPRRMAQQVDLRIEGGTFSVEQRWARPMSAPNRGEEAYRVWLVDHLVAGRSLAAPPPRLATAGYSAIVAVLVSLSALLALLPFEVPAWLARALAGAAMVTALAVPPAFLLARLGGAGTIGYRLVFPGTLLALAALAFLLALPSAWELDGVSRRDPPEVVVRAARAAARDARPIPEIAWLPLTGFELHAARMRSELERALRDRGSEEARPLLDAIAEEGDDSLWLERQLVALGAAARPAVRDALSDPRPIVRAVAARTLCREPLGPAAEERLRALFRDPAGVVRYAAVDSCGRAPSAILRAELRDRLADPDWAIVRRALEVVAAVRDRESVTRLVPRLRDGSSEAEAAAEALAAIGDERAAEPLFESLERFAAGSPASDPTGAVERSIRRVVALGPAALPAVLARVGGDHERLALAVLAGLIAWHPEALVLELPAPVLGQLRALAGDPLDARRHPALGLLARAGDADAVAMARAALAGPDGFVVLRPLLARGLAERDDLDRWSRHDDPAIEEVVWAPPLPACIEDIALSVALDPDHSEGIRARALHAVARSSCDLPPQWWEQVAASDAIRFMSGLDRVTATIDVSALCALLRSPDGELRALAASSLALRSPDVAVEDCLLRALAEERANDPAVVEALGLLQVRAAAPPLAQRLLAHFDAIDEAPWSERSRDAAETVIALGRIGEPSARPALAEFLACPTPLRCAVAVALMPSSGQAPALAAWSELAASSIGMTGDAAVVPLLRSGFERPLVVAVRPLALAALGRLGAAGARDLNDCRLVADAGASAPADRGLSAPADVPGESAR